MSENEHDPEQEPETYELAEVDDEPSSVKPGFDPRLASHDLSETNDDASPPIAEGGTSGGSGGPKLLEGIAEPAYVDPELQSMRREEARKRASQEAAVAAERNRRIKLRVWGVILVVVVVAAGYFLSRG